ncbi:MAG: zf-HC2 domain-containing protein [Thermodesulfobacteriota bacterium]|nr:zf-HC2 domain-containing protein [Thermodesulfobacteriota bacterium]
MKICRHFQNDAILRHYGELPAGEDERLTEHLARCEACSAYVRDMEKMLALTTRERDMATPSPVFWQAYQAGIRERIDKQRRVCWWKTPALAAVFSVLLFLGVWFLYPGDRAERPEMYDLPVSAEEAHLVKHLDMLQEYDLIKDLDAIEQIQDTSQRPVPRVYVHA